MAKKGSTSPTTVAPTPGADSEKKVSLYEAEKLLSQLEEAMESEEGLTEEQLTELADAYLEASHQIQHAVERYLYVIQGREERGALRRAEGRIWRTKADGLSKLAATDENLAKRLRLRLLAFMDGRGINKLSMNLFEVTAKNAGGKASLVIDQDLLPTLEYLADHYPQLLRIELDEGKLRDWLEAGNSAMTKDQQPFASLQRGRVLQIKPSVRPD